MYFKIEKTSPLGQQIAALWARISAYRKRVAELAVQLSDMEDPGVFTSPNYMAGYLFGIQFKEHPGKQWAEIKKHREYGSRFFNPSAREWNKKDSELKKQWTSANDPITHADFCGLFGLKPGIVGDRLTWYKSPAFSATPNVFIVSIELPNSLVEENCRRSRTR